MLFAASPAPLFAASPTPLFAAPPTLLKVRVKGGSNTAPSKIDDMLNLNSCSVL